ELCQAALGTALMFCKRHEEAQFRIRAALKLNPNFVDAISILGMSCVYTRDFAAAEKNLRKALELSPRSNFSMWAKIHLGALYFIKKDYDKAIEWVEECLSENPGMPTGYRILAAIYGQLGNLEAAAQAYKKFAEFLPNDTLSETKATMLFVEQEDIDLYIDGLRLAGMPE
ncbi:MAG: tetratricopeptide repeat protein, partial [Pseudomonadota bacterium]